MVLGTDYYTCANLLAASMDDKCLGKETFLRDFYLLSTSY